MSVQYGFRLATLKLYVLMSVRYDTKGRVEFKAWLKNHGITHREIAELLGIDSKKIACWNTGSMTPGYPDREAIERLTHIPMLKWLTEEELRARQVKFARLDRLAKTRGKKPDLFESLAARV